MGYYFGKYRSKIMKKILCFAMASILLTVGAVACSSSTGESGGKTSETVAAVWSADNTVRFMREDDVPSDIVSEMVIESFKGETESVQLMIRPDKDVSSFKVVAGDFVSGDKVIGKDNLEIFAERYIETKSPSVKNPRTAEMYTGYYPDALIPIDRYVKKKENKIKKGENQGIWFNVNVPEDAESGEYESKITLSLDGDEIKTTLKLKVYNVQMPKEIHNVNSFGLWYHYIKYGEGSKISDDTYSNYYWFLANKRITPVYIPYEGCDLGMAYCPKDTDGYAEALVEYAKNPIVSGYGLPCNPTDTGKGYSVIDGQTLTNLLKSIILKNIDLRKSGDKTDILKKAYIYAGNIIDEPDESHAAQVKECDRIITAAKNEVKHLLSDEPDLLASLIALKHVVTITPKVNRQVFEGDDETGGIQTWCPYISEFNSDSYLKWAKERSENSTRMNGEDFWWYNCIEPENPFPSYQLDDNLIATRVMEWMKYDYKISGHLYWSVNFWYKCLSYDNGGKYTSRDIWNDPNTFETANGDGHLIYPGKDYALNTPISTLRLESIREGNEDYEYLWMFGEKIKELNQTEGTNFDGDKILSAFFKRIYTGVVPKTDPEEFKSVRRELMQLIEQLFNDKQGAIESLNKIN